MLSSQGYQSKSILNSSTEGISGIQAIPFIYQIPKGIYSFNFVQSILTTSSVTGQRTATIEIQDHKGNSILFKEQRTQGNNKIKRYIWGTGHNATNFATASRSAFYEYLPFNLILLENWKIIINVENTKNGDNHIIAFQCDEQK